MTTGLFEGQRVKSRNLQWEKGQKMTTQRCFWSVPEFWFIQRWFKSLYEHGFVLENGLMTSIRVFYFKKRRHQILTFSTNSKMLMDALCVVLRVTDGSSIVTITIANWALSLTNVVLTTCLTCQSIKKVHGITCEMPTYFEWFTCALKMKRVALIDILTTRAGQ